MQAYCPVSFALKLAAFCLLLGVVVGVWLTTAVSVPESQPSQPNRTPTTQVAEALPGRP
jgi:hypothetical protein